jgi:uncharacterized protein (TIGR01777 family)
MKILISGASGLVGTALTAVFRREGHTVGHLVRPGGPARPGDIRWDPTSATVERAALEASDALVHLSGANISGGRWTPARKQVLRSSRVDTTRFLVDSLSRLGRKPRVFISASAVGYYGSRGDEVLTESMRPGTDFLSALARDWETEASRAQASGIRTVMLRFGVILSSSGGALPRMMTPFKFGVGGPLADGEQWMSWIALEDVIGIVRFAIANAELSGPVNVVAPNPVRNGDFSRVLAKVLHRPAVFSAPRLVLRLALGEMADALLLVSQRAHPAKLLAMGYRFRFDDLGTALREIIDREA